MIIPQAAAFIIEKLNKKGFEAYVVGGCVRDFCRRIQPKDYDITTSAKPEEVKRIFHATFDTGIQHGTVTVVLDTVNYEVTTYRIDGTYSDGRHPDSVMFSQHLVEDLQRRDFTMNAIAYHPQEGFVDPMHGREDIANQTIRAVGVADDRFAEDALRMLRAIRFAAQLGFSIEEQTMAAIVRNAERIQKVSVERIRDEFLKLLHGAYVCEVHPYVLGHRLFAFANERLGQYITEHWEQVVPSFRDERSNEKSYLRMTLLFRFLPREELAAMLEYFRLDHATVKKVLLLSEWLLVSISEDLVAVRRVLAQIGTEALAEGLLLREILGEDVAAVRRTLETVMANGDCFRLKDLRVNGNDLKQIGITEGKKIGETLGFLLDAVMQKPDLNSKETLLALAKREC